MSSSRNGEVCEVEYKDWIINIKGALQPSSECCIYRVPTRIRNVNKEAYTPQVVSIGPFHYGKKELEFMERQKGRYVREFFSKNHEKYEEVLAFIKDKEQHIRNCYSEICDLESHEFVMMILRDAIFIIELLLRDSNSNASDFLLSIPAERIALMLDLLLLENQLPYFLLEGLYKLVFSSTSFLDLCFKFFKNEMFDIEKFDSVPEETIFEHFTDLQRIALVKSYPKQKFDHVFSDVDLPSAAKLRESGVKFTRVDPMECLLDIKFERHELKIPQLKVYDETEATLRNIMALEQCHYPYDTPVCDYVELLDSYRYQKRFGFAY